MNYYFVDIPGVGLFYMAGANPSAAIAPLLAQLKQEGIVLPPGTSLTPTAISKADIPSGAQITGEEPVMGPAAPIDDPSGNGGYGTGTDFGIQDDATEGTLDEQFPIAAYLRGAGQRTGLDVTRPRTLADRIVADQGFDFFAPFRLRELLSGFGDPGLGIEGTDPTGQQSRFENYSAGRDIWGARNDARSNLAALFGQSASSPMGGPLEQLSYNPSSAAASNLVQNARGALAGSISPWALSLIDLPDADQLVNAYQARTGGGAPEPGYDFLQELRRRYGLDRIGL